MLDCTPVKFQELLLAMVARFSATVVVGQPACYDEAWLQASTKYAGHATVTVFTLKAMRVILPLIFSLVLPSYWAASTLVCRRVGILVSMI